MSRDALVIITGTTSGLGRSMATRVAKAGFRVVGIARRDVTALDLGLQAGQYSHICFDLSDIDQIGPMVSRLVREHGVPYGLVNNAAIGTDGILPTMHNSDITTLVACNITSPLILTKYVTRSMLSAQTGRVVSISSVVARTGYRGLSVYAATKAALEGFTRSLARDLGPRGVTVNCVAPGFAATAMTEPLGTESLERIRRRSPLGRFPDADEIAAAVVFLLGEDAAAITGSTVTVDAGNSA